MLRQATKRHGRDPKGLKALPSLASTTLKKDDRKGEKKNKREEEEIHSLGLFQYWREWVKAPQKQLNKEERKNKERGEVQGRLKGRRAFQVTLSPSPSRDPQSMSQKLLMTSS